MSNWLSNLKLDQPYKVPILIFGTLFIMSFLFNIKGFTPNKAQLLFGGLLSISLAWWQMDFTKIHTIKDNITGDFSRNEKYIIRPNLVGVILVLIGLILFGKFVGIT